MANKKESQKKESQKIVYLKNALIEKQKQRLALKIGTHSIGWAIYNLDEDEKPMNIAATGVRVFSPGREESHHPALGVVRRQKKLQRRMRDRYLQRRNFLLSLLKEHGLFPEDELSSKKLEKLNPYELRAKGLDDRLDIHHFGRALFHINQKRGFKSNRKMEDPKEASVINKSMDISRDSMKRSGARTYGEFLWKRFQKMEENRKKSNPGSQQEHWVLARKAVGAGSNDKYAVFAGREMIVDEFEKLWNSQARFHKKLRDTKLKDQFSKAIFFQRRLKQPIVGLCSLLKDQRKIPKASPYFQRFRILKELNHLNYLNNIGDSYWITELENGLEFRDELIDKFFLKQKTVSLKKIEQRFRSFFPDIKNFLRFELSSNRKSLEGDRTSYVLRKILPNWDQWSLEIQDRFIELLEGGSEEGGFIRDDDEVFGDLMEFNESENLDLSEKEVRKCLENFDKLPTGHGKYSKKVIQKIVPFLENGFVESEAINFSGLRDQGCRYRAKLVDKLSRYQEALGHCLELRNFDSEDGSRVSNPKIHIAFNQLRLLINDIIRTYGKPFQIVVEVDRDLPLGRTIKKEKQRKNKENKKRTTEARKCLEELGKKPNKSNLLRYLLWKEQNETCVYSGKRIPKSRIFTADWKVDHILPFSKTLDDSFSNKVLVCKSFIREKFDSPFDFFSSDETSWEEILKRVENLPKKKQWRFRTDAMKRFLDGEINFLERHMNDPRYVSKHIKQYLEKICTDVWTVRGQVTSVIGNLLRSPRKREKYNKDDYRNHVEDALIVGLMDRSFLQHISNIAMDMEKQDRQRIENMEKVKKRKVLPWSSFKKDAKQSIDKVVVSYRKRVRKEGQLHKGPAYGFSSKINDFSKPVKVLRYVGIMNMAGAKAEENHFKEIKKIVSHRVKKDFLGELGKTGRISKEFLQNYHKIQGVRRIRIEENKKVIPIKNKSGKPYKAFVEGGNHAMELFKRPDGRWDGEVTDIFTANQKNFRPIPKRAKLMKGDMLYFENDFWRLIKFEKKSRNLVFLKHFVSGNLDKVCRKHIKRVTPDPLRKLNPERVDISPCGVLKRTPFNLKEKQYHSQRAV